MNDKELLKAMEIHRAIYKCCPCCDRLVDIKDKEKKKFLDHE